KEALKILEKCPAHCDTSCYRCPRSFRNKIEHGLLDRKLGSNSCYPGDRVASSLEILSTDLRRQCPEFRVERNARRRVGSNDVVVPIVMIGNTGAETWIGLSSPIAPDVP